MSTPDPSAEPVASLTPLDLLGMGLISLSLITLEIFQTKVFSYSLSSLLLYCVIGLALIGIGAGATFVSMLGDLALRTRKRLALAAAIAYGGSIVITHLLFCWIVPELPVYFSFLLVLLAAVLAIPYIFVGVTIALIISYSGSRAHTAYGVNLLGSGLGCFVVFLLLRPLGGEAFVFFSAGLAWLAAAVLAVPFGRKACAGVVLLAAASAAALPLATQVFFFPPEKGGQLDMIEALAEKTGVQTTIEFDEWDPTGRIQVHSYHRVPGYPADRRYPFLFYSQDSSAGSYLVERRVDYEEIPKLFENTLYRQAYYREEPVDVLVIGLGGGPDILTALYHEARSVVGVEINGAAVRMGLGPMNEVLGGAYRDPRVEVIVQDGRSYVASTKRKFDIIQMSGTDTKHLMAAGSLAINECYLYTVEAFEQYFSKLNPGGVISIIRFGSKDALRLASIAVAALGKRGVESPDRNFVVLHAGNLASLLIKREPFTPEECERIAAPYRARKPGPRVVFLDAFGLSVAPPPVVDYLPGSVEKPPYREFFQAVREGTVGAWLERSEENFSASTDDHPFYFDLTKYSLAGFSLPSHMTFILNALLILAGLAVLLIFTPLVVFRLRNVSVGRTWRELIYFASLGLAFMFVEIALIHHFTLFLGHQTYSFTVVVFGILAASGLGSLASGRLVRMSARRARMVLAAIVVLAVAYQTALPGLLLDRMGASFTIRVLLSFAFLFPIGFLMGMPFPTGLRAVSLRAPRFMPWAIGVNGALSVIATTSAVPVALVLGFSVLLFLGAFLYAMAAVVFRIQAPAPTG
jgi:hypothetical protein